MRLAYELAYSNALIFAKANIILKSLDEVTFRKPVPIGCLLNLTSQVVYSSSKVFQVSVVAEVLDSVEGTRETTNVFEYLNLT
jgi:acyl-coenzyme A thioesterase 9